MTKKYFNTQISDVRYNNLKKLLDKQDFKQFSDLIFANFNNKQWLKSTGYVGTQPSIGFVGAIILQNAILDVFDNIKKIKNSERIRYFSSPDFVNNVMSDISHILLPSGKDKDDEDFTEFGDWIKNVFNASFNVRKKYGGGSATAECSKILWPNSTKQEYMRTKQKKCYICERGWLGEKPESDDSGGSETPPICYPPDGILPETVTFDINLVHCEHVVPFLAALSHVRLARVKEYNDPIEEEMEILKIQYELAHKGCNELKNNYQMYMKNTKTAKDQLTEAITSNTKRAREPLSGGVAKPPDKSQDNSRYNLRSLVAKNPVESSIAKNPVESSVAKQDVRRSKRIQATKAQNPPPIEVSNKNQLTSTEETGTSDDDDDNTTVDLFTEAYTNETIDEAAYLIDQGTAPENLKEEFIKVKSLESNEKKQLEVASKFKFMYVPNIKMIQTFYESLVDGRYIFWGTDAKGVPNKFNSNSRTLNKLCGSSGTAKNIRSIQIKVSEWGKNPPSYPILPRVREVLKYINTNIDKLRTNDVSEEQVEMLYDLWCKYKLILALSPEKLQAILIAKDQDIDSRDGGSGSVSIQSGGATVNDYDIMKSYVTKTVDELFGNEASLNIPLQIYGKFQLILGMTVRELNANNTYYQFVMNDKGQYRSHKTDDTRKDITESDDVLSQGSQDKVKALVNGIYQYVHDTKNKMKYLQKVVDGKLGKKLGKDKFFIMKDPTDPLYAVEYVNFGSVTNSKGDKTFGIYTVFSKDIMGRTLTSSGGQGGGDNDDNDKDNDDGENEGDVRYANFRRVSKTLRVNKHKHDKASSKRSKTFKKKYK
jgi:hypothetical protein